MKKGYIFTILIVIFMCFLLISCASKLKAPDPTPAPTPTVNTPPSTPTYVSPGNAAIVDNSLILFTWNRSQDDGAYIVYNFYLSDDPTQLATPLYTRIQDTAKYIGGLQASTTYYWKVEAMDDLDLTTSGEVWSVFIEQDYQNDPAVPVLPADDALDCWLNLYLEWEPASFFHDGPVVYDVYYGERYQSPELVAHDISATSLEVTGLAYATEYSWKIVAKNTSEDESIESNTSHFSTVDSRPPSTVDITFPFDNQVDLKTDLVLVWENPARAIGDYYVYGAAEGQTAEFVCNVGESTGCTLSNLDYSTDYFFYIEQRQPGGIVNLSDDIHFTTKEARSPYAPEIVSPANRVTDQATTLTFSWIGNGDPNDMKIYFDIYTGEDESNLHLNKMGINATSTTLTGFDTEKQYYWRVNARNVDGYESRSRIFSFSTAGYVAPEEPTPTNNLPTKPVNEFPANGDNIREDSLFFDWSESTDVEGIVKYNLYLSENATFTTPFATELTENHLIVTTLKGTKSYFWTVEAFDEEGSSTYSDPTSFVLLGM
ncbi:MAG TPA: hypothetical protein PLO84_13605 [Thermotogota bacterium]|nr:hypothetical protein [Thermotogota bacterium]